MLVKQCVGGWLALAVALGACSSNNGTDAGTDAGPNRMDTGTDVPSTIDGGVHTAVTQFHYDPQRTGANRAEIRLTVAALQAGGLHRDAAFDPTLDGQVYAQPLYLPQLAIGGATHDTLFVATQSNTVYALDADTGAQLWTTNLGAPVPRTMLPCGNIHTTGVLGTPVIDAASGTLYAVSYTPTGGLHFVLNALDVITGQQRSGYPAPIMPPSSNGATFTPNTQQQRGALALVDGKVYIPFGGLWGDCGVYHGWLVGVDVANPSTQTAFATATAGAGMWAPGGPSSDGAGHLYGVTGNGFGTMTNHSNVVLRFGAGPVLASGTTEYFQPSNTGNLDAQDIDLGSLAPIVLPDQVGSSTAHLLFVAGKAGVANLIDRDDLGGRATGDGVTGEGVFSMQIFDGGSFAAAATWSNGTDTYVFLQGYGSRAAPCSGTGGVAALRLSTTGGATTYAPAWCTASGSDTAAPTVSSNGNHDGVLWVTDAHARTLRAYNIADGSMLYTAANADLPTSVQRWTPPLVVDGRVFVTGGNAAGGGPTGSNPPSALFLYHL